MGSHVYGKAVCLQRYIGIISRHFEGAALLVLRGVYCILTRLMTGNKSGAGLLTTFVLKPGAAANGLPKRPAASAVKGRQSVGQIGVASLRQAGAHGLATRGHGAAGNSSAHSPALGREQTRVRFPGTTAVASAAELPNRSLVTRIGEPRRVARAFVEAAACGLALMYQVRSLDRVALAVEPDREGGASLPARHELNVAPRPSLALLSDIPITRASSQDPDA
jgi:hypothetical protein